MQQNQYKEKNFTIIHGYIKKEKISQVNNLSVQLKKLVKKKKKLSLNQQKEGHNQQYSRNKLNRDYTNNRNKSTKLKIVFENKHNHQTLN